MEEAETGMLQTAVTAALQRNQRVGCLLYRLEAGDLPPSVIVTRMGGSVEDYAQRLFAALRALDKLDLDVIIVEGVQGQGLGVAVMDRLRRAAFPPKPSIEFTES
jgi:L-threonylcarbamoyladenylate synthase